ncbi:MAG: hypothetical protein QN168_11830 [Armatimonadota bacterium]|nr:hypothetical protein [Armatimonadota bacterium]
MKIFAVLLIALAVALAPATVRTAQAAVKTAPFRLEGKIVEVSKGWIQVEVIKVVQGSGFKAGDKVKITESSRTRILQAGKRVSNSKLATGEMVEVSGQMVEGKTPTFRATTVSILK